MTTETKKKYGHWISEFMKTAITPGLLVVIIWKGAMWYEGLNNELKTRGFDTPEDKTETMWHVRNARTELEDYKSKQRNDSLLNILKDKASKMDSISVIIDLAKKNAVSIYQIKKEQKDSYEKLKQAIDNIK